MKIQLLFLDGVTLDDMKSSFLFKILHTLVTFFFQYKY